MLDGTGSNIQSNTCKYYNITLSLILAYNQYGIDKMCISNKKIKSKNHVKSAYLKNIHNKISKKTKTEKCQNRILDKRRSATEKVLNVA